MGKTWVAAGLTAALRQRGVEAVYFKPMQSGCPREEGRLIPTDADFARNLAGLNEPLEVLTPIALELPLAPGVAAAQAGVEIDLGRIAAGLEDLAGRYEFLVVEGAGGLYVPLVGTHFLVLDLIRWLNLPLAVVAKSGLGTINHTVLTVKAAQAAGVTVAGVILNRYPGEAGAGGGDQSRGDRGPHRGAHPGPAAGSAGPDFPGRPGGFSGGDQAHCRTNLGFCPQRIELMGLAKVFPVVAHAPRSQFPPNPPLAKGGTERHGFASPPLGKGDLPSSNQEKFLAKALRARCITIPGSYQYGRVKPRTGRA